MLKINARNAGRPKGRKFISVSVGLTPEQLAFLTKQGGNKYLRALIEREIKTPVCKLCGSKTDENGFCIKRDVFVNDFGMGEK